MPKLLQDPIFVIILTVFAIITWYVGKQWFTQLRMRGFDDEVVENNIRRLVTKKNIQVSPVDLALVIRTLEEVDGLRVLLKDPDLNHFLVRREIFQKVQECADVYRRAGVPDNRISQTVPISKF